MSIQQTVYGKLYHLDRSFETILLADDDIESSSMIHTTVFTSLNLICVDNLICIRDLSFFYFAIMIVDFLTHPLSWTSIYHPWYFWHASTCGSPKWCSFALRSEIYLESFITYNFVFRASVHCPHRDIDSFFKWFFQLIFYKSLLYGPTGMQILFSTWSDFVRRGSFHCHWNTESSFLWRKSTICHLSQ